MTKDKLMGIVKANLIGEYVTEAKRFAAGETLAATAILPTVSIVNLYMSADSLYVAAYPERRMSGEKEE